jgi:hypothetical protein
MSNEAYHLHDFQTLTLDTDDTDTATPVAGIRGVTVTPNISLDELYTADDTEVEELKQREFKADVEIEYAKFSPEIVKEWLGGAGASATQWGNNSDPQEFSFEFVIDSEGTDQLTVELGRLVFEEMPIFDGSNDDFAEWGLSGTAYALRNLDETSGA